MWIGIGIGLFIFVLVFGGLLLQFYSAKKSTKSPKTDHSTTVELDKSEIQILADYVKTQKIQAEETKRLADLKKCEMKHKLEVFKQTREQLKDKLRSQINEKEWKPLEVILKNADKGGVGIYILYNQTKDKYYVGQAKQLYKRVRDHFIVEDLTHDFLSGDKFAVKFLTANELDSDYRLDHIEKTGIEIFNSDKNNGYNKTTGNI